MANNRSAGRPRKTYLTLGEVGPNSLPSSIFWGGAGGGSPETKLGLLSAPWPPNASQLRKELRDLSSYAQPPTHSTRVKGRLQEGDHFQCDHQRPIG